MKMISSTLKQFHLLEFIRLLFLAKYKIIG